MKELLENFAAILGALTVALLVLAISHEYGYFWIIGREFQALLTTTDYLGNAIFWLPLAIIYTRYNVDWWRLEQEPTKRDWKNWKAWIWPSLCTAFAVLIVLTSTWPPSSGIVFSFLAFSIWFWSKVWRKFSVERLPEPYKTAAREVVRLLPPAMIAMFAWGWWEADWDLVRFSDVYAFKLKGREAPEMRITLRSFDKGILVRNPVANRIEFYRWDTVEQMSRASVEKSRTSLCYWFEWCPSRPPTSPL